MRPPALCRRRSVWFPTLWGWAVLLLLVLLGSFGVRRELYPFLALERPVGANLLVVEGWLGDEGMQRAAQVFLTGGYERVVTSGGPISHWADRIGFATYAELAADTLVQLGLPAGSVVAVPAPASAQERTFLSAVMVREWAARQGLALEAIDVFSSGPHARRTRLLYRMAFGAGVRVGILAARPDGYEPRTWWRTSAGVKTILAEALSLLWTELFFWPGPPGSVDEAWAVPAGGSATR